MEGDAKALLEISAIVVVSMSYSLLVSRATRAGLPRLLCLLPLILLFPFLPLRIASISLRGLTAFFLVWLSLFKLLLLSFSRGPLSPSLPLLSFIAISSLPVKISTTSSRSSPTNTLFLSLLRFVFLLLIISSYQFEHNFNHYFLIILYGLHIYLILELILALVAVSVRVGLGLDLEPPFNEPYKSTSLRDFWGRRWNLMVTSILRPSVYHPVSTRWGQEAGVMATFMVSGAMHEVMFWYLTWAGPTGEVTLFFVVNAVGMFVEEFGRRKGWGKGVRREVKTVVTFGFVAGTGYLLFFPPILRTGADRVGVMEAVAAARLLEDAGRRVGRWLMGQKL